jgi:hypothetical protein
MTEVTTQQCPVDMASSRSPADETSPSGPTVFSDRVSGPQYFREKYLPAIQTIQEIGMIASVISMVEFAESNLPRPVDRDISDALIATHEWIEGSLAYEAIHGVGSMLDVLHPTYVRNQAARQRFAQWKSNGFKS